MTSAERWIPGAQGRGVDPVEGVGCAARPQGHSERDRKVFLSPDSKGEQLPKAKTPPEQDLLRRPIAATDKEIDALVCGSRGLTEEEEIATVERGDARREAAA